MYILYCVEPLFLICQLGISGNMISNAPLGYIDGELKMQGWSSDLYFLIPFEKFRDSVLVGLKTDW